MAFETIEISDSQAEVRIAPSIGAGLVSYDMRTESGTIPIFRGCDDVQNAGPFDLAMNLLAPWSNRISGGGFTYRGRFYALEPNLPGEPCPIHGNAFSSSWIVERRQPASATLSFFSDGPGPFHYFASVAYVLEKGQLDISLTVENHASYTLPYGVGLHPWLPRSAGALLQAQAERVVLEDGRHLPAGERALDADNEWNFNGSRPLPSRWINNAFLDWDGYARIDWTDRELSLEITADAPLRTFIVYSPGASADFFCFEPISHPVDAHNLEGPIEKRGLVELAPGESIKAHCRFAPQRR
jgi:aldose 1-epimerase